MRIGVLALQGAFREHVQALSLLGVEATEVRLPRDLAGIDGLILPGGESTTMTNLMTSYGFWEPLKNAHAAGLAIWGTCAGAILLAAEVAGTSPNLPDQPSLGLIDMTVRRNAFGRQVDSFVTPLTIEGLNEPFSAVFIRAPIFERVGEGVEVLATLDGETVMAKQGRVMASSFHPELGHDPRIHGLFLEILEPA